MTIPALVTDNRSILKASGYVVAFCGVFTMGIGLDLWVLTLTMRSEYEKIWTSQPSDIQSMMQISVCFIFGSHITLFSLCAQAPNAQ